MKGCRACGGRAVCLIRCLVDLQAAMRRREELPSNRAWKLFCSRPSMRNRGRYHHAPRGVLPVCRVEAPASRGLRGCVPWRQRGADATLQAAGAVGSRASPARALPGHGAGRWRLSRSPSRRKSQKSSAVLGVGPRRAFPGPPLTTRSCSWMTLQRLSLAPSNPCFPVHVALDGVVEAGRVGEGSQAMFS